jgi:hypothetical protein
VFNISSQDDDCPAGVKLYDHMVSVKDSFTRHQRRWLDALQGPGGGSGSNARSAGEDGVDDDDGENGQADGGSSSSPVQLPLTSEESVGEPGSAAVAGQAADRAQQQQERLRRVLDLVAADQVGGCRRKP